MWMPVHIREQYVDAGAAKALAIPLVDTASGDEEVGDAGAGGDVVDR
jgi:hypothetical protein